MTSTPRKSLPLLPNAWLRLQEVSRQLWEANSPAAVETQAILEEFKGEVSRIDAQFSLADEHQLHEAAEHEEEIAYLGFSIFQ